MKRAIKHYFMRHASSIFGLRFLNVLKPRCPDATELARSGYVCLQEALDENLLHVIDTKITSAFSDVCTWNKIYLHVHSESADVRGTVARDPAMLCAGPEDARQYTNFISIRNPFLVCPELVEIVRSSSLRSIVSRYLGPNWALSGANVRRSFVTSFDDMETNKWHVDGNSGRFLKLFVYLNDVESHLDGPTEYIRGSHSKKPSGWDRSYRIPNEYLTRMFSASEFILLTGKRGDVRIVDTTGIHRGLKVISTDRVMITLNFCTHEELPRVRRREELRCDFSSQIISKFVEDFPRYSKRLWS
jgi:hypothetical protein